MAMTIINHLIAGTDITAAEVVAHTDAAIAAGDLVVYNVRTISEVERYIAKVKAGGPAATDHQVNYLIRLLAQSDAQSFLSDLYTTEGYVNIDAVRRLSKQVASTIIDQLTGRY